MNEEKELVFLAHDPGGYEAVFPVYEQMKSQEGIAARLLLGELEGQIETEERETREKILDYIKSRLRESRLRMLITGTSWKSDVEVEAIRLCREKAVTTVSILDYWCNYASRFQYGGGHMFPDYYFVMDALGFEEARKDGVDPSIMRITGNPGLDKYLGRKVRPGGSGKLLFLSQPLSALYGERLGYTEFGVMRDVLRAGAALGYQVDIKFHPKETRRAVKEYGGHRVDGRIEDMASGYDAVIGMNTMGLLQCALMGMPVISYQPGLKREDVCVTNKLGITKGAYDYPELTERMRAIDRARDVAYPFWFDGKSTWRCVDKIWDILKKTERE